MPRVPIIDQPSVRATALPSFRGNVTFQQGHAGEGIRAAGALTEKTAGEVNQEQDRADAARAVEELGAFTREADAVLLDPTVDEATQKPKGYKLLQGEDAFGARDAYQAKIDQLVEQHVDTLENDNQKAAFMAHARDKVTTYAREIQAHAGNEAEKAQSQSYKTNREAELQHVASFADDPQGRDTSISNLRLVAMSEAGRLGLKATDQQKWADLAETDARAAALNSLIARGNVAEAEAFYAVSKDKLGDKGDRIERQIQELHIATVVDEKASAIVAASLIPGTSWAAPGKALAAVEAMKNVRPEEKDRIRKAVEHQVTKLEQTRVDTAERYMSYGLTVYNETGTIQSPAMAPVRAWLLDPANGAANYWQRIVNVDDQRKALGRTSSAEERRAQAEANALARAEYLALSPGEQVRTNIDGKYAGRADQTTLYGLKRVQSSSRKIIEGGGLASETEFQRFATRAAKDAKLKKDVAADFVMSIADWRVKYLEDHDGQEPTRAEMKAAVADSLLYGEREEGEGVLGWFQPNRYKFQAKELGEKFKPFPPEEQPYAGAKAEQYKATAANKDEFGPNGLPIIPAAPTAVAAPVGPTESRKAEIRALFKARGKTATDEQILRVWRAQEGVE
jgi:hypothetical protein